VILERLFTFYRRRERGGVNDVSQSRRAPMT
jgi:hypothetical protein